MQKQVKHKIVIIGCGNVAWHLAKQFHYLKKYEVSVYNHRPNVLLSDFKTKLKCTKYTSIDKIMPDADFYFICVSDKFISTVAKKIKTKSGIVIHTSGSMKIEALGAHNNVAVFYPLQTFSKQDDINWKEVPVIIETNNLLTKTKIVNLAKQFSNNINSFHYKQRLKLHLAAVLVNNFTNALVVAASDIVLKNTNLLLPLIKQTVNKLEKIEPRRAQTGPAKRNDTDVMKKHLKLLSGNKDMQKIYKQLSALILKQQTN